MKKTLISLIGALTLATVPIQPAQAQTIKPTGEIEISYAPDINLYGMTNPVLKTRLKAGIDINFNKDFSAYFFGAETTYSLLPSNSIYFNPLIQGYDLGAGLIYDNFEFYLFHNCTHPVMKSPIAAYDSNNNGYWVNQSGITEVGVKWKW